MVKVQHFSESLEGNFRNLGVEVERQRQNPETANLPEREVVKRAIQSISNTQITRDDLKEEHKESKRNLNLPNYLSAEENPKVAEEVEGLVEIALTEGIFEAIKKAKKYSAFTQDALHDALVDKVLPELKKRGLV